MEPKFVGFKPHVDKTGKLSPTEGNDLGFEVKRTFIIYDVPKKKIRGGHAHTETKQVLRCTSGSCKVSLDDGLDEIEVTLDSIERGLFVDVGIWHSMYDFILGTCLLVYASTEYDKDRDDYLETYEDFVDWLGQTGRR